MASEVASFDIDVAVSVIIDLWTKMKTYPVIETYNLSMIQLHFWKI